MKLNKSSQSHLWFTILMMMSFLMLILALSEMSTMNTTLYMWELFTLYNSHMYIPIIMDPKGLLFSTIVLFISANVILFSYYYMCHEFFINRFLYLVIAFVLSMNMLIFFPHFMLMLMGWDGLGLISYLLVIYYQNNKSLSAGMITAMTNRLGDAFLLLAIALTLNQNHWFIINMWTNQMMIIVSLMILLAAMTKSAQIPFSSWLPAAMAAPTPVSALVHSSTLVTAGIFIIIRFYSFIYQFYWMFIISLFIGTMTMFMAGMIAMTEYDLKKIIALSTLSQLGLMFTTLGLNQINLAYFHLLTHALFKSLLFLCAGNIILMNHHNQDMRLVGNLMNQLPVTSSALFLSSMSLMGIPFMTGYYSKDIIIEMSMWNPFSMFTMYLMIISTALTAMYSMRFFIYMFIIPNMFLPLSNFNKENMNSSLPIFNLSLSALIMGSMMTWIMYPMNFMPQLSQNKKLFTIFLVMLSMLIIYISLIYMSKWLKKILMKSPFILLMQSLMWFLSPISSQMILSTMLPLSHFLYKNVDQSWIEDTISATIPKPIMFYNNKLQLMNKSNINMLMLIMMMNLPIIMYMYS